jgi:hypothetical protein
MADGSKKIAAKVKKGDTVLGHNGTGTVVCVLKTVTEGHCRLVPLSKDLRISPWHPVLVGDEWRFPITLTGESEVECDAVYSFLLDQTHTMLVGGIPVICLGHELKGEVVSHPFLGTKKVVETMTGMKGFDEGLIVIRSVTRNAKGLINGFISY